MADANAKIEDLQLQLQISLCQASMDVIKVIAERIGIEQATWKDKKIQMVAIVSEFLEKELDKLGTDEQVVMLEDLLGRCKETNTESQNEEPVVVQNNKEQEVELLKEQLKKLQTSQEKELEETKAKLDQAEEKLRGKTTNNSSLPAMLGPTSALRRQFKIIGQIGEPNQKDKLNYTSLVRQIEAGQEQGYTEAEIVNGVICAISPSMVLRSYLEMFSDLTLDRLRKIIHSHYDVKDTTELYQSLASVCQGPKESPQAFLMRALDLRQKIIFTSTKGSDTLQYDADHIQKLFLRTIETGLQDESIRAKLRPYLKDVTIQDEDLIHQLNVAVSSESERSRKMKSQSNTKVGQASLVSTDQESKRHSQPTKPTTSPSDVMAVIQGIKTEVESLRAEVRNKSMQHGDTRAKGKQPSRRTLCSSCQESGNTNCQHCFVCGDDSHYAAGCRRKSSKQSLNGPRLLPRDR